MKQITILTIWLILMSSSCEKEEDCHAYINFTNQSEQDVIFGLRSTNFEQNCCLNGTKVMKNETFDFRPYNSCIERNLNINMTLDIYIIDSDKYNNPGVFYDCDSIAIKNRILKQYNLTLDDLKQSNFTINYP